MAVDLMKKAGYTIPDSLDLNALTPSAYLKTLDNAQKTADSNAMNPLQFTDSQDQMVMQQAINAVNGKVSDERLQTIKTLISSGKRDDAINMVKGIVKSTLTGTDATEVPARDVIINLSDTVMNGLQKLQTSGAQRGLYAEKWSDAQKFLNKSQDPSYLSLSSQISTLEAAILHSTYGSRLTDTELKFAAKWVPTSSDTVLDAIGKLRNLKDFMSSRNDAVLNAGMGSASYTPSTLPGSAPPAYNSNFYNSLIFGSGTGSFSPSGKMKGGVDTTIGGRTITGAPPAVSALEKADSALFAATGEHLDINSSFRSSAQQQQAYNDYLSGKIARAAKPGTSLHEKGLAFDVTNWKKAEPYLVAAGLTPLGPIGSKIRSQDPAHFQLSHS